MPSATVTVDAPIDKVFTLLADLTTHPGWSPDVLSATQSTDGPVRLGTRFRHEIKGIVKSEIGITVHDKPNSVEFRGSVKMGDVCHLFSLTAEGDRTRVDTRSSKCARGVSGSC